MEGPGISRRSYFALRTCHPNTLVISAGLYKMENTMINKLEGTGQITSDPSVNMHGCSTSPMG
jgi:hypothetical protein